MAQRILIACEESGVVRDAFIARGFDAWSCDILLRSHPRHITGDVLEHLGDGWDMMIAFPPCTHLCASGARHFAAKRRDGRPCPVRKGRTFRRWVSMLQAEGYAVEWRTLRACDYGAPTIRKRLFLVARCDGESITWPEVTHGEAVECDRQGARRARSNRDRQGEGRIGSRRSWIGASVPDEWGDDNQPDDERILHSAGAPRGAIDHDLRADTERLKPFRTAAECIDWSLPCPSIFERRKPLAEATLRRIARGIVRYVLQAAEPFIVTNTTGHAPHSTREPLSTITTGDHHYLVEPFVVGAGGSGRAARWEIA